LRSQAARDLETDDDEKHSSEKLGKIARQKLSNPPKKPKARKNA
jgi:hypothetical protein